MKNFFTTVLILFIICSLKAQQLKAYAIYDAEGNEVSFQKMSDSLSNYEVVLFGEFHDHPVVHWLQKKLTEKLYAKNPNLVLGAEMFEADNQLILDEYLQDKIPQNRFEEEMRLWNNYKTDYKPLIEFAKPTIFNLWLPMCQDVMHRLLLNMVSILYKPILKKQSLTLQNSP